MSSPPVSRPAICIAPDPSNHALLPTPSGAAPNEEVLDQLTGFSFAHPSSRKLSLPGPLPPYAQPAAINLSLRRSGNAILFRPPSSSLPHKASFSPGELVLHHSLSNRPRIPSFSTDLEPISASPTSPNSPMTSLPNTHLHNQSATQLGIPDQARLSNQHPPPSSASAWKTRLDFANAAPSSSSSSSFCSSSEDGLLRRASSSSLASVASVTSSNNGSTGSLKARRGSKKPLFLAMPPLPLPGLTAISVASTSVPSSSSNHAGPPSSDAQSGAFRSLPPSPRFSTSDHLGHTRDQFVGIKANLTGGLSMKRRTSIPRLSLSGTSSSHTSNGRPCIAINGSNDYIRLLGRNPENSMVIVPSSTPVRLHFDPVAAQDGKRELMSSQAGFEGKGHIERPAPGANGEVAEEFPYQNGPRQVLPGLFLGSEQNARDPSLLRRMGFGYIVNVAKEVECPWTSPIASQSPSTTPSAEERNSAENPSGNPSHLNHPNSLATPPRLQQSSSNNGNGRTLLVRPTASTPNLHCSFKRSPESVNRQHLRSTTCHADTNAGGKGLLARGEIDVQFAADEQTGRPALQYRKLPWSHDQDGLAAGAFDAAFEGIDRALASGRRTLVHCQCGVSRSATLVIAYCMRQSVLENGRGGMHESYTFVKEKSPWAGPNMGLIYQLIEYEKVLKKKTCQLSVVPGVQEEEEDEGARTPTRGDE